MKKPKSESRPNNVGLLMGDETAQFDAYVRDKRSALIGALSKITRNRLLAEDLSQRVYEKVWKQRERTPNYAKLPLSWWFMVGKRLFLADRRLLRNRREHVPARASAQTMDVPVPARQYTAVFGAEIVGLIEGSLSEDEFKVFELFYRYGYTVVETSCRLGDSLGTTKGRLWTGNKKVKLIVERQRAEECAK